MWNNQCDGKLSVNWKIDLEAHQKFNWNKEVEWTSQLNIRIFLELFVLIGHIFLRRTWVGW